MKPVKWGIISTANIGVAIESGADLIICYNPFRPFNNKVIARYSQEKKKHVVEGKHIADHGVFSVLNQVFRILLHTRLDYGIDLYRRDPRFRGDIILIRLHPAARANLSNSSMICSYSFASSPGPQIAHTPNARIAMPIKFFSPPDSKPRTTSSARWSVISTMARSEVTVSRS